jgi:hypothetical protein
MSLPLFEHLTIYPKKDSTHMQFKWGNKTKEQYICKSYNQENFGEEMNENYSFLHKFLPSWQNKLVSEDILHQKNHLLQRVALTTSQKDPYVLLLQA